MPGQEGGPTLGRDDRFGTKRIPTCAIPQGRRKRPAAILESLPHASHTTVSTNIVVRPFVPSRWSASELPYCHGRGREFESRRPRQLFRLLTTSRWSSVRDLSPLQVHFVFSSITATRPGTGWPQTTARGLSRTRTSASDLPKIFLAATRASDKIGGRDPTPWASVAIMWAPACVINHSAVCCACLPHRPVMEFAVT